MSLEEMPVMSVMMRATTTRLREVKNWWGWYVEPKRQMLFAKRKDNLAGRNLR